MVGKCCAGVRAADARCPLILLFTACGTHLGSGVAPWLADSYLLRIRGGRQTVEIWHCSEQQSESQACLNTTVVFVSLFCIFAGFV